MDELYARFLPQFVALARTRLAAAIITAEQRDQATTTTMMRELHTIAGEAGLLGLTAVVPLARDCEQRAKLLQVGGLGDDGLLASLHRLAQAIEALTPTRT
jgi:HPt (histidine-containing phosphotransfer) domain-containing protein